MPTTQSLRIAYRRLKRGLNILRGRDVYFRRTCHRRTVCYGAPKASWHVLPDLIGSDSIVYAFGVGTDVSFDLALTRTYGAVVHAFDPTPASIDWFHQQDLPEKIRLHEYGLSSTDGSMKLFPPRNPDHISHTVVDAAHAHGDAIEVPMKRLSTICGELGHNRVDLLKIDIEGAEYRVIDDILKSGIVIGQWLVEFHHCMHEIPIQSTRDAIEQLLSHGYQIFHVTETGREYGFVRSSLVK